MKLYYLFLCFIYYKTLAASSMLIKPINQECFLPMYKNSCSYHSNNACFGTSLSYQWTSNALIHQKDNIAKLIKFDKWSLISSIPNCWQALQPLLCSLYRPRCEVNTSFSESPVLHLPSKLTCKLAKQKCSILMDLNIWPEFLHCNRSIFTLDCPSEVVTFNNSISCAWPLVPTTDSISYYGNIENCALTCFDPRYSNEDRQKVHSIIASLLVFSFVFSTFAIIAYILNKKKPINSYLFQVNLSFYFSLFGLCPQFFPIGSHGHFLCREDGTLRRSEESLLYLLVFILTYYFTSAALIWFTIVIYALSQNLHCWVAKVTQEVRASKLTWVYHLMPWGISLILLILCLSFAKIEGDIMTGIWIIGLEDFNFRIIFILLPINILTFIIIVSLIMGIYRLVLTYKSVSIEIKTKIKYTIIKLCCQILVFLIFCVMFNASNVFIYLYKDKWQESLNKYIICKTRVMELVSEVKECRLDSQPSILMTFLHILSYFLLINIANFWVLKNHTISSWKMAFKNLCKRKNRNKSSDENKHRLLKKLPSKEQMGNVDFTSVSSIQSSPLSNTFWRRKRPESDMPSLTSLSDQTTTRNLSSRNSYSSHWSSNSRPTDHMTSDIDSDWMIRTFPNLYKKKAVDAECSSNRRDEVEATKKVVSERVVCIFDVNGMSRGSGLLGGVEERTSSLLQMMRASRKSIEDSPINLAADEPLDNMSVESISDSILDSGSNQTVASSDTDALSIELDENYQPIMLNAPINLLGSQNGKIAETIFKKGSEFTYPTPMPSTFSPFDFANSYTKDLPSSHSTPNPTPYPMSNPMLNPNTVFPPPYHSICPSAFPYFYPFLPPCYFYMLQENHSMMEAFNSRMNYNANPWWQGMQQYYSQMLAKDTKEDASAPPTFVQLTPDSPMSDATSKKASMNDSYESLNSSREGLEFLTDVDAVYVEKYDQDKVLDDYPCVSYNNSHIPAQDTTSIFKYPNGVVLPNGNTDGRDGESSDEENDCEAETALKKMVNNETIEERRRRKRRNRKKWIDNIALSSYN